MAEDEPAVRPVDDSARIVRFMIVKAAIFIGIPLAAAVIAVVLTLR